MCALLPLQRDHDLLARDRGIDILDLREPAGLGQAVRFIVTDLLNIADSNILDWPGSYLAPQVEDTTLRETARCTV